MLYDFGADSNGKIFVRPRYSVAGTGKKHARPAERFQKSVRNLVNIAGEAGVSEIGLKSPRAHRKSFGRAVRKNIVEADNIVKAQESDGVRGINFVAVEISLDAVALFVKIFFCQFHFRQM